MSNTTRQKQTPAAKGVGDANTPAVDSLLLQSYFDKELPVDEATKLTQLFSQNDASAPDALRLSALAEMSELVQFENEQEIEDVDLSGLWSRIEGALDPAPTATKTTSATVARGGWFERLRTFFDAQRAVLIPTMAMAAAALLILIPLLANQAPKMPTLDPQAETPAVPIAVTPAQPETTPSETNPVNIDKGLNIADAIDENNPPILVFIQPPSSPQDDWFTAVKHSGQSANPSPYPVIWLMGDKDSGEDPKMLAPNAKIWPAVQEVLRQLPKTIQQVPVPESPGTTNGEPPRQGPI